MSDSPLLEGAVDQPLPGEESDDNREFKATKNISRYSSRGWRLGTGGGRES